MKKPLLFIVAAIALQLPGASQVLAQGDTLRFEFGGQFSLLSRNRPSSQADEFPGFDFFNNLFPRRVNKPGFGTRFTYNMTKNIAFEAEGNFFPERQAVSGVPDGHVFQGQFGVKAGKRCEKVGFFGKLRPGFVTFAKSSHFTGFREVRRFIHPVE